MFHSIMVTYFTLGLLWASIALYGHLKDNAKEYSPADHVFYFFFTTICWIYVAYLIMKKVWEDHNGH